jgi:benzoylformate decarboxylase
MEARQTSTKSRSITGRSAFLTLLAQEGVRMLFGNPGTTELPIMDSLAEHPEMRYVLGLQEAVVTTMAEGHARATGQLTAVNVHVAPGLGNAMGSIYGAKRSGAPLIITAGQQQQGFSLSEPVLHDHLVPMAAPLVKWAIEITRAEDLPVILHRAAKIALTPPTGPVFLSLPGDVLNATAEIELGHPTRVDSAVRPSDRALEALADRLLDAEAPVIVAGNEVNTSSAFEELAALASLLGAPVYCPPVTFSSVFPSAHPCYAGEITRDQRKMRATLDKSDLLFAVGLDVFTVSIPGPVDPIPPGLPILQLGLRDADLGKNYPAEMAIRADVKTALDALLRVIQQRRTSRHADAANRRLEALRPRNWSANREARRAALDKAAATKPIDPEYLMATIAKILPDNGTIVDEGITTSRPLLSHLEIRDPKRYFGLCGGGIGWGLPGAVGVKLGLPERPVVCISGDGSAMYTVQALWSASHEKLPLTFVICNNGSYRILKERLFLYGGEAVAREAFIGMDLDNPSIDWVSLAGAFGMKAKRVLEPAEIKPALEEALASKVPMLLDIHVARGFKP